MPTPIEIAKALRTAADQAEDDEVNIEDVLDSIKQIIKDTAVQDRVADTDSDIGPEEQSRQQFVANAIQAVDMALDGISSLITQEAAIETAVLEPRKFISTTDDLPDDLGPAELSAELTNLYDRLSTYTSFFSTAKDKLSLLRERLTK